MLVITTCCAVSGAHTPTGPPFVRLGSAETRQRNTSPIFPSPATHNLWEHAGDAMSGLTGGIFSAASSQSVCSRKMFPEPNVLCQEKVKRFCRKSETASQKGAFKRFDAQ